MTERNRRILAAALVLAAVVLLGYALLVVTLMVRGEYEVGPVRVVTVVVNVATSLLCLWGARLLGKVPPPGR